MQNRRFIHFAKKGCKKVGNGREKQCLPSVFDKNTEKVMINGNYFLSLQRK